MALLNDEAISNLRSIHEKRVLWQECIDVSRWDSSIGAIRFQKSTYAKPRALINVRRCHFHNSMLRSQCTVVLSWNRV